MCYNTNEYGCSLFDTLFCVNRNTRTNGCWQGCRSMCNQCGWTWNGCQTMPTNTCGGNCGNGQVFSLPVTGRVFFRIGANAGRSCLNTTSSGCYDAYYATQYGLNGGGNNYRCGCNG